MTFLPPFFQRSLILSSIFLPFQAAVADPSWSQLGPGLEVSALAQPSKKTSGKRFTKLDGTALGLEFHNQLDPPNIKNYLLSGAGLTVGDIDGNGLPDLFLVSQDGPNKLFHQIAPWKFEDVTTQSGIKDLKTWGAGAAFVDIDNDKDLDLYVCNKGAFDEIYLNRGDGTFTGGTIGKGDASLRAPTMVAFADYDLDGDLDFYRTETRLLSIKELFKGKIHLVKDENGDWQPDPRYKGEFEMIDGSPWELGTQDHFYQNRGTPENPLNFKEVTLSSGIKRSRDHGLAAVWWDFNNDRYPDLYISNDFQTPDRLYRNNRDGTFSEVIGDCMPYTSWNSMGSDFADINNDGWFDYLSTDMSATTHFKQKTMMGAMSATGYLLDHLEPRQYMRNAMQVNTGTGKFIDTAFFSGLDSTDWTWAGNFGDLDNDGFEDAYFTNGIERNVQDSDTNLEMEQARKAGRTFEELHKIFLKGPRHAENNLAFRNLGTLKFENSTQDWGLDHLSVSHGALLVDLDRDGDLDIIVNNMNDPVGVFRNDSQEHNGILVSLVGTKSNSFGLGACLTAHLPDGQKLSRFVTSSRGYMSGAEAITHFGTGMHEKISSLHILWPGGAEQTISNLNSGRHYRVTESQGTPAPPLATAKPLFASPKNTLGITFRHQENDYNDFAAQPLLPNRLSRFGPALAAGDVNGDKLPDLYFGGAAGSPGKLYLQTKDGRYSTKRLPISHAHAHHEDVDACFFDVDQDNDLDLYVVSGGASKPDRDKSYQDRLYLNDGTGNFGTLAPLPPLANSGSCVASCDFDGDGDLDLFVGSRHVPKQYPTGPKSSLLINNGGKFTPTDSPANNAGMVTGALWADIDLDKDPDLIVATEWGPVMIFENTPEGLIDATKNSGLANLTGWWTSLASGDFDRDGDLDLLAGNFGHNTKYHVDAEHPATLFASDFGGQGQLQLVEAQHKEGRLLPVRGRSCSTSAMPHLLKNAPSYTAFASKTLTELYSSQALKNAMKFEANTLSSMIFINDGKGHFKANSLPTLAQLSPVMSIAVVDFDRDGILDAALGQNFNDAQRETGRMNAGLNVILKGTGKGTFTEFWPLESGLQSRNNTRKVIVLDLNQDQKPDLLFGNNNEVPTLHFNQSK